MTESSSFLVPVKKKCGLRLFVQPKASKTKIVGLHDGMVKLTVSAPPVDGKANKIVIAFLADLFKVKKSEVAIVSGEQARRKVCVVGDLQEKDIKRVLAPYLPIA